MNSDIQTASPAVEELQQRLSDLARNKSRLELINRLLTSLSTVAGLDNMLQHVLDILMQTIGAANISIIFQLDGVWQYRDIFGTNRTFPELDNPDAARVLDGGKPLRFGGVGMPAPFTGAAGSVAVENWIFPLPAQERIIGVICMDGMQLTDAGIFDELQPFFVYAGVMLNNEFNSYAQLAEAHRKTQESEALHRTLFEESHDGIYLVDPESMEIRHFNAAAHRNLGYSHDEFAGMRIEDLDANESNEDILARGRSVLHAGYVAFETRHRTKEGEIRNILATIKLVSIAGQQMLYCISRDITEQKRSEESMALMNFALDNIHEAAYLIDERARIRYVNAESCRALGYSKEELITMSVHDVDPDFPVDRWGAHWNELKESQVETFESRHRTKDGRIYCVEINGTFFNYNGVDYVLSLVRDTSERKRAESERQKLEQQMLHAQKLESLGILAGGIAHDFNNILMAIIGNADLALMRINRESPAVDNLQRIEQAAARAADLAKQMLAYSGKGKFVVEIIDLNILLEEMLHMLEVSISKKAVLRLNPYPHLPPVEADATQMRQIIMNLVINASEAIGEKSGVIAITTGCMDCDRNYLKDVWLDEHLTDGLYVYLEIADSGCGMDTETLSKLFDPFFTTKFTGRGLGMAAVLGIVRGHKGAIKVYSEPGRGTTFKILLPASGRPADIFNGKAHGDEWQGNGTVLLVDDEETIRGIGAEMLKELGFSTVTAGDGREALEIFTSTPDIAFVILDLTMPRMDGEQCFRELRRINPDVKVIMSSGYNEQEVTQRFIGKGLAGFIQKPYRLSTLQEVIRTITG